MTATAQGTAMKCDHPQCTAPATVEQGAWGYCAVHAGKDVASTQPVEVRPRPDLSRAHTPGAVDLRSVDTTPASAPAPSGIGLLLEQASRHSNGRVRKAAERIETSLEQLRALVDSLADDERCKQAEKAAKEKARADIARLEQQLAAAKAALRGTPAPARPAKPATNGDVTTSPHPCADCGGSVTRPAGIVGRFPTRCATCKAAS